MERKKEIESEGESKRREKRVVGYTRKEIFLEKYIKKSMMHIGKEKKRQESFRIRQLEGKR